MHSKVRYEQNGEGNKIDSSTFTTELHTGTQWEAGGKTATPTFRGKLLTTIVLMERLFSTQVWHPKNLVKKITTASLRSSNQKRFEKPKI